MQKIINFIKTPDGIKFIKFCLVGAVNTGISFLVFVLLVSQKFTSPGAANIIGYCAGLANSYLLNKFWTFNSKQSNSWNLIFRFIAVNLVAMAAGFYTLQTIIALSSINHYLAQVLSLALSTVINFIGNRLWVFKN